MLRFVPIALLLVALVPLASRAQAQPTPASSPEPAAEPAVLTLEEALQVALANNYAVRQARLDVDQAEAQIDEGWGQLMPQVDVSSTYTRNLKNANPFAGSEAGGLFSSLGFLDWLAFNERARTDADPTTQPIALETFLERQQAALAAAGVTPGGGDNPFAVPNSFRAGFTVSQILFDARAIRGATGAAKYLRAFNARALERQEQVLVNQVRQAYYDALLAQEQARVVALSVERTTQTLNEVARQVTQGIAPKFRRLSAEVEVTNLRTQLVQTQTRAATSLDNLKLTLGIPVNQPVRLRGDLDVDDFGALTTISTDEAVRLAVTNRPDLEQADIAIGLQEVQLGVARAGYFPRLSANFNATYIGNVPDDRSSLVSDPNDPFAFSQRQNDFFSSSYWDWDVNVGLTLSWNVFNGFQTRERVQQNKIALEKATIDYERLLNGIRLEVDAALRNLRAAQQNILAQESNVQTAELNYDFARTRLDEGVASQLEEREASEQLDQSRLNYAQAVHDYLVAKSALETALGLPLTDDDDLNLTAR